MTEPEYPLSQAAKITKIPLSTIQQAVANGLIPTTLRYVGKDIRHFVSKPALDAFSEQYDATMNKHQLRTPIVPPPLKPRPPREIAEEAKAVGVARRRREMREEAAAVGLSPQEMWGDLYTGN